MLSSTSRSPFDHAPLPVPSADPLDLLIGLDDTDDTDSPDTGVHAGEIGRLIGARGLGEPLGLTWHQLLFDPRISFTTRNRSVCICVRGAPDEAAVARLCREYLQAHGARGSAAGLCLHRRGAVTTGVRQWGRRAQTEVLTLIDAQALAIDQNVLLDGVTGNRGGMIGALAAVGLQSVGQEDRCLWFDTPPHAVQDVQAIGVVAPRT